VYDLQPDTTYYVQLCTLDPGPVNEGCTRTNFTTGDAPPPPPNRVQYYQAIMNYAATVRQMTQGLSNVPLPGSALYDEVLSYGGDPSQPAECGDFVVTLLNILTQNNILSRIRSITLDGPEGHVSGEFWDPFSQQYDVIDPFFGVAFVDQELSSGQSAEQISALLLTGDYSDIHTYFVTNYGSQFMTSYYLDPITLYNNVIPFGKISSYDELNDIPNTPLTFLNEVDFDDEGQAGVYVFDFQNQTDSVVIQDRGSSFTISPANIQGWAAAVSLHSGWTISSAVPPGMRVFTFTRVMF
jgi:hypothetical protein